MNRLEWMGVEMALKQMIGETRAQVHTGAIALLIEESPRLVSVDALSRRTGWKDTSMKVCMCWSRQFLREMGLPFDITTVWGARGYWLSKPSADIILAAVKAWVDAPAEDRDDIAA